MIWAFDLKLVLIGLLAIIGLIGGVAWWLARRTRPALLPLLEPVLANAPVGVLWLDSQGQLRQANAQARALLGLSGAAAVLPLTEWAARLAEDTVAVVHAGPGGGRARTVDLNAQQTWRWWITPWQDGALALIADISAEQQAAQATQLLLSDLAHELRTPLATLSAHLEVLRLPSVAPEIHDQSLRFLRDETQRLVRLVNNTLDLGRLESSPQPDLRAVDLFPLVEEVVQQLHGEAQSRGLDVGIEAATNLPPVLGQADRLRQVFLNLVDNAVKYGRAGDRVTIGLHCLPDGVACSVCDTGPGIAPEHLPYVTRRFYRAVPSGMPGSGLGLALVAEILRQHGATLEICSRTAATVAPGESTGTCMRFVLATLSQEAVT
jgi:signal transduction histidine kinase